MENNETSILLKKINDLENLIKNGQNVYPVLKDILNLKNEILNSFNELKSQMVDGDFVDFNNFKSKLEQQQNKIEELENINQQYNESHSKLVRKPLQLLEILSNEIRNGRNLSDDLSAIDSAINTLKNYEFDNISSKNISKTNLISSIKSQNDEILNSSNNSIAFRELMNDVNKMLRVVDEELAKVKRLLGIEEIDINNLSENENTNLEENTNITSSEIENPAVENKYDESENFEDKDLNKDFERNNDLEEEFSEDEFDEEDYEEDEFIEEDEEILDISDKQRIMTPKFDESYLDEDTYSYKKDDDDDDDLLKYYRS